MINKMYQSIQPSSRPSFKAVTCNNMSVTYMLVISYTVTRALYINFAKDCKSHQSIPTLQLFFIFICLMDCRPGIQSLPSLDAQGSIALPYVMEIMTGENGIEWFLEQRAVWPPTWT